MAAGVLRSNETVKWPLRLALAVLALWLLWLAVALLPWIAWSVLGD